MTFIEQQVILNDTYFFMTSENQESLFNLAKELASDNYKFSDINFNPEDIVIDIGGNIGIMSIYLAKKYPFLKIITIEPVYRTYMFLLRNIWLNKITNIFPINCAITGDGKQLTLYVDYSISGGASSKVIVTDNHDTITVNSMTLDNIFEMFKLDKVKLLKIDCEGSEYEILYNTNNLSNIEYIRAEFHINKKLQEEGRSWDDLATYCADIIGQYPKIYYEYCIMSD